MTFAEFSNLGLDCEDCPIREAEYCTSGSCFDRDPPCSSANPDQEMSNWIKEKDEQVARYEAYQDKQFKEQQKKKQIAEQRTKTLRAMRAYCFTELRELSQHKKALRDIKQAIQKAECFAEAINVTNEMFKMEDRKAAVSPQLYVLLEAVKQKLAKAQEAYELRRKEFYSNRT